MDNKNDKEITNAELLESINRSFSSVEDKISNIENKLTNFELKVTTDIHDLSMDLKSFKKDATDSIEKQEADIADLNDTVFHQDKRIEKLENKAFA